MRTLAREVGTATVGSSDAHHPAHVDMAATAIPLRGGDVVERFAEATGSLATAAAWGVASKVGPRSVEAQAGWSWALDPVREIGTDLHAVLARQGWRPNFRRRWRRRMKG